MLPVLALVGRPNVGKSTLFNQLTRSRDALVADLSGLTRDRQYGQGRLDETAFIVIDTGGISGEIAAIDWLAIAASMPSSSPEMPPVSMTIKAVSSSCPWPYCRSRVRPDKLATKASRLRVSWLNSVDLPTLGRPTKASTGSMMSVSRFDVVGFQGTVVGVDKQPVAPRDHVGSRAL